MFTDIVGSSALAEALGDCICMQTVQAHLDLASRVIAAHGGQMVKSLGDGTMSSFPSARAALAAAQELRAANQGLETEPALSLRLGIHSGDVIQTEDDFFGTVVNKDARLTSVAEPDEILVSETTRLLAGGKGSFAFTDPREVALKGLPGQHVVFPLHRNSDMASHCNPKQQAKQGKISQATRNSLLLVPNTPG